MAIVQRCRLTSRVSAWALVCMLCASFGAAMLPAADQPATDVADLVKEIDRPDQFMLLTVNRFDIVWSELQRSKLFKQFGADAGMQKTAAKVMETVNGKLKLVEALKPGLPAGFSLEQFGRIGPVVGSFNLSLDGPNEFSQFRIGHACDEAYLRMMAGLLTDEDGEFLEQMFTRPNPVFQVHANAYRVRDGWTILQADGGAKQLLSANRMLFSGASLSEEQLLKTSATAQPSRIDFVNYLKGNGVWLSGYVLDFNSIAQMAEANTDQYGPKNPDLFGGKGLGLLRVREAVSAAGRFEAAADCAGVDLHKHLFFGGIERPMTVNLSKAVPEDSAIVLYGNLDFGAICAAGPDQFAGHSPAYADFIKELRAELMSVVDGTSRWEAPPPGVVKVPGPTLDIGIMWTVYDPDQLQDIEHAYTIAFGVKPGFKPTEAWARQVLHHSKDEDNNGGMEGQDSVFKGIEYGGVTIWTSKRWRTTCLAVTDSVFILGEDLKYMKRMIRAVQNIESQQADKNNFTEWAALQALAAKEGGNLAGYGLVRSPALLAKYGHMAVGGLAMLVPGIETDMDWTKMTAGLEPALGVITYTPEKGFKAKVVSDLPVATSMISGGIVGLLGQQLWEGRWWGRNEPGEDDLPPLAGADGNAGWNDATPPAVPQPVVEEVAPVEEVVPAEEVAPVEGQ